MSHEGDGQRRLAAILFSDIVGYTARMEASEEQAMRLRERHRSLLRELAARHHGEVVDENGDELVVAFQSASDSVQCALAVQAELRDDAALRLRIGIHLGDVVFEGGRIYGDGVNVASRIRPLAAAGGICVSAPVYDSVKNQPGVSARSIGEKRLKNVARPVEVFAVREAGAAVAPSKAARRGRPVLVGVGALLAAVAVIGAVPRLRVPVVAAGLLALPRLLPVAVEQEVAFTHSADGTRIAWATLGSGPPLVLVLPEGVSHLELGPFSPTYNGPVLARLGASHRVVRYDPRGFGLSQRGVEQSHEARVADLEAVVGVAGLDRFDLWGYSGGALAAISFAARHPDRVTRLILYGASANPESAFDRETAEAYVQMLRTSWGQDDRGLKNLAATVFLPDASEIELEIVKRTQQLIGNGEDFAATAESLAGVDVSAEAARVRCPTLIVHRRGDLYVPYEHGLALAAAIPDARLVTLAGSNHVFLPRDREELEKMIGAIEAFLVESP